MIPMKKPLNIYKRAPLEMLSWAHIDYSRNYPGEDFWDYEIDTDAKPGVNLDWEAWLGPAPKRDWDPYRYFQVEKVLGLFGGL